MVARLLAVMLVLASFASAAEEPERPSVGLVLGGGGARGAAHIGVLRVLEREQIPVDFVVGTSMGAIVGGLYASGMSADEIEEALLAIDWDALFDDDPPRRRLNFRRKIDDRRGFVKLESGVDREGLTVPTGLVAGQKLAFVLQSTLLHTFGIDDFDALPIPFRAVATDLERGDIAVLDSGSLPAAIRASMSVPLIFAPAEIDGRTLVDGGIVNNLPIDVARDHGVDRIIVVDVTSPLGSFEGASVFSVAGRTLDVLTFENVRTTRTEVLPGELLITPDIPISSSEFERAAEAIEAGERAGEAAVERLQPWAIDAASYERRARRLDRVDDLDPGTVRIDEIVLRTGDRVDHRQLTERIETRAGATLDLELLAADLERIYQIGEFERVE